MSSTTEAESSKDGSGQKRRRIITVACNNCRSRKTRCNGSRPACQRCSDKRLTCVYEARENESRVGALKRDNQLLRTQLEELENAALPDLSNMRLSPLGVGSASFTSPMEMSPYASAASLGERFPQTSLPGGSSVPASAQRESTYTVCMTLLQALINRSDAEATLILAKLRTLISWSQIVDELSDPISGAALIKIEGGQHEELMIGLPQTASDEPEIQSSFGTWYNSLTSTAWLPLLFDRNVWKTIGTTGKGSSRARADHVSVAISCLHENAGQILAGVSNEARSENPSALASHARNVEVPHWALKSLADASLVEEPFEAILQSLRAEIDNGVAVETLCGPHAYVAALYDEKVYRSAPKLSQLAASIVRSIKFEPLPLSLTVMGMTWLCWSLFRWTLMPSEQTYAELPEILAPNRSQIFVRHPFVLDFVLSPELRDYLCTTGNFDLSWIAPAFETLTCECSITLAEAVGSNSATGDLDLTEETKEEIGKTEAWSIDQSVKAVFPEIGRFFRIRSNDSHV